MDPQTQKQIKPTIKPHINNHPYETKQFYKHTVYINSPYTFTYTTTEFKPWFLEKE